MSQNTEQSQAQSRDAQGNFPGEYDSTSSGGYGTAANVWSQKSQRGFDNSRTSARVEPYETPEVKERGREGADESQTGLVDQSTTGGDLAGEIQDAKQGGEGRWPDESRIL